MSKVGFFGRLRALLFPEPPPPVASWDSVESRRDRLLDAISHEHHLVSSGKVSREQSLVPTLRKQLQELDAQYSEQ